MEHSATSKFEYDLAQVMKKHGMSTSFCMYHPAETPANACKVVYFNKPSLEWIMGSFENLAREIEHRRRKGLIMSAVEKFPDVSKSDVEKVREAKIDDKVVLQVVKENN